jgi:hypothetical protein
MTVCSEMEMNGPAGSCSLVFTCKETHNSVVPWDKLALRQPAKWYQLEWVKVQNRMTGQYMRGMCACGVLSCLSTAVQRTVSLAQCVLC